MDISFLTSYLVAVIVGICLCVGFVVKSIGVIPNKFIPLINAIVGLGIAFWINYPVITPEVVLSGLFSGLASTGLFEMFKNLIGGDK